MHQDKTVGMDLGDKTHQVCVLDARGEVICEERIGAGPEALAQWSRRWAGTKVVMEAGGQSMWISRRLERLGHVVIVANARRVRLIWQSGRKSDRTDAQMLARLGRADEQLLAGVRHRGEQVQADLGLVQAREALVKSRTALINHVRGAVKAMGGRVPTGSAESFARRAGAYLPELLRAGLEPLLETIAALTVQIAGYGRAIQAVADERYPQTERVRQVPGVGPITALVWALVMGEAGRCANGRSAGAYVGLVPRRDQSGALDRQLRISKAGNGLMRRLLVTAAHYVLGPFGPDGRLRRWGLALAERGGKNGKKRAVVATARKLAAVLWRLWQGAVPYDPWHEPAGAVRPRGAAQRSAGQAGAECF